MSLRLYATAFLAAIAVAAPLPTGMLINILRIVLPIKIPAKLRKCSQLRGRFNAEGWRGSQFLRSALKF